MAGVNLPDNTALVPSSTTPVSLGQLAAEMRAKGDPMWTVAAEALDAIARAFIAYQQQLKQSNNGQISQVQVTSPDGKVLGWIGINGPVGGGFYLGYKTDPPIVITSISNASPAVVTTAVIHHYTSGDTVTISNDSIPGYNGNWIIKVLSTTTYELNGSAALGAGTGGLSTRYFAGIWAQTAAFGGTQFSDAKIKAQADGEVFINGARIELDGTDTVIVLDPVSGNVTVTNVPGTVQTLINSAGVVVQSLPSHNPASAMGVGTVFVTDGAGAVQATMSGSGFNTGPLGQYKAQGAVVIDNNANALFLSLKINGGLVIDSSRNANFTTLKIGSTLVIDGGRSAFFTDLTIGGTLAINSARDANLLSVTVNGIWTIASTGSAHLFDLTIGGGGIDSSGNVSSANGFTGTQTYLKNMSINFVAQTATPTFGTITTVNGIVTSMT